MDRVPNVLASEDNTLVADKDWLEVAVSPLHAAAFDSRAGNVRGVDGFFIPLSFLISRAFSCGD